MPSHSIFGSRAGRGFTLVEVLVATAILSFVVVALLSAMRSVGLTEERIDQRIADGEDLRSTVQLLHEVTSRISPQRLSAESAAARQIAFRGAESELEWIGVMPARHGAGGLYRFRLFLQPALGKEPAALALQFAPMTKRDAPLQSEPLETRIMARNVSGVSFRYLDADGANPQWTSSWGETQRLPDRIGLRAHVGRKEWPEIVVTVVPTGDAVLKGRSRGGSGPVIGP